MTVSCYVIAHACSDNVSFSDFDPGAGDLYPQVHMKYAEGFVGSVREGLLGDSLRFGRLFEAGFYIPLPRRLNISGSSSGKYGNQLEYLWEKSPDTAVS